LSFGPIQILWFIVAISVLVAVHEFGHFWVGRRLGFKVLRFSVGFGRPLAMRVAADGTEYAIGMIPLGGYVRFADERDGEVAESDRASAFNRRPVWARILVLIAGPAANFLFAIAAFWGLYLYGVPGLKPVVGDVRAESYAAHAGLRSGDEIVAVGGVPVTNMEATVIATVYGVVDNGRIEFSVRRAGTLAPAIVIQVPAEGRRALTEPGALYEGLGFAFFQPHLPVIVDRVVAGGPAATAGLRAGDEVLAIDGEKVAGFPEFRDRIGRLGGTTVELEVRRGTADLRLPVTVRSEPDPAGGSRPAVGRIGIAPAPAAFPASMQVVDRYGPIAAIGPAVHRTWQTTAVTLKFLWRMLTGGASLKNLNGPISIATYAGLSAREGFGSFLMFLAAVSISLGILNLMPVPVLDGGGVVYQLAEAVRGGPLPLRIQALGQQVGIVLLLLLMSLAFYNDLRHFG
jgi:regulator of sigma E protease